MCCGCVRVTWISRWRRGSRTRLRRSGVRRSCSPPRPCVGGKAMLTDAQIAVAVRLNTAIMALHEATKLTIQYGWPDYTEELRQALNILLATHKAVTEEEK